MKRNLSGILAVAALLALWGSAAFSQQMSGRDIAQKVHDSNKSSSGIVLKGQMTLKNLKNGSTETRSVMTLTVRQGGLSKSLFRFTDSTYSGTTFLTIERQGSDNLQYLFLKSVGSPRQIEGSDREKNFVDTDLSHEDLGGSRVDDYNYNRLSDVKIDGRDCYVIERIPKRRDSNYSKHVVVIDTQTMLPVSMKSYGRTGRLEKTIKSSDLRQISNQIFIPMRMEVSDLVNRHQTVLQVTQAQEKSVNPGYFNRNRLGVRWAEQ